MTDRDETSQEAPAKASSGGIAIAAIVFVVGAGAAGGFVALDPLGLRAPPGEPVPVAMPAEAQAPDSAVAFIPLPPVIVALGPDRGHLRFAATLDVVPSRRAEVEAVLPRVSDILVTYLRAVDGNDLADPAALFLLRAQMMRRIQLVVGEEAVNDLLITEFILG